MKNRGKHDKALLQGSFTLLILLTSLLCSSFGALFGATLDSGTIFLNTEVPASTTFEITDTYGAPVSSIPVTWGVPYTNLKFAFSYSGTNTVSLKITSANGSGTSLRMKHQQQNNTYVAYTLKFDYDGQGSQQPAVVQHNVVKNLVKYQNSYDNLSGSMSIETPGETLIISGSYKDTITFYITGT